MRVGGWAQGEGEGERESEANSLLSAEPDMGGSGGGGYVGCLGVVVGWGLGGGL